jgi:hypothetical protein
LKPRSLADVAEVQRELMVALNSISTEDLRQCFQQWKWLWDHCIHRGSTLKGTKVSDLYKYFKYKVSDLYKYFKNIFLTMLGIFEFPLFA